MLCRAILLLGCALTFFLTILLMVAGDHGLRTSVLWVGATLLLLAGAAPRLSGISGALRQADLTPLIILAPLYGLRFFLLLQADVLPFHGDEAILSFHAEKAFRQGMYSGEWNLLGSQAGPISRFPALWYYQQGAILHVFGPSVSTTKLFSLITDMGISLLLYYLARSWFGRREGLAAIAIYASLPIVIHFGMTGLQNIQSTFFLFLSAYALHRGMNQPAEAQRFHLILAGVLCGVGMYYYLSSLLNPFILLAFLISFTLSRSGPSVGQRLWAVMRKATHFTIGFLFSAGPFLIYSFKEYNFLAGRSGAYDFWLRSELFVETLLKHAEAYYKGFYHERMNGAGLFYVNLPAFPHILIAFLFLLGLAWAAIRIRRAEQGAPLIWIVLLMTSVFGGILTEDPPAPQRLMHLYPVIGIVIVAGVHVIGRFGEKIIRRPAGYSVLFWALILACLTFNLHAFFTQNLPVYKERSFWRGQQAFVDYYMEHELSTKVLLHIPIHMRDQIYYYSNGKIEPRYVNEWSLLPEVERLSASSSSVLLLTDPEGKQRLREADHLTWQKMERDCPNGFDLLIIYLEDLRSGASPG